MIRVFVAVILSTSLFPMAFAQSLPDSAQAKLLKEIYYANTAFVLDGNWSTTQGSRPIGNQWKLVAEEFEISPEGNFTYQLARDQRKRGNMFGLIGLGLAIGTAPLLGNSSSAVIGIGTTLGSWSFFAISFSNNSKSRNNFEKALWLRNRDAMVQQISILSQPEFQYVYETETLYLTNRGYIKNGKKYILGPFSKNAASEFRNTPTAWGLYQQYRKNNLTGLALYSAGIASIFASLLVTRNKRPGNSTNIILYMGGLSASIAGTGLMSGGYKRLRQAIYFRNYEVLERETARRGLSF